MRELARPGRGDCHEGALGGHPKPVPDRCGVPDGPRGAVPPAASRPVPAQGRQSLKLLLKANKRLNTAYLLKESFGQLWDYQTEGWARRFFNNWCDALKWQRLGPYQKFAEMIDRHWDGIAAYCKSENKVALGFVEGFNNKIRVIQRRATAYVTRNTYA